MKSIVVLSDKSAKIFRSLFDIAEILNIPLMHCGSDSSRMTSVAVEKLALIIFKEPQVSEM